MLTRLYRFLPQGVRSKIYELFLGKVLYIVRNPKLTFQNRILKYRFRKYAALFRNKSGIEIGGPSFVFSTEGHFPVYKLCRSIDGCNYASSTIWEGEIQNSTYQYKDNELGVQHIGEATEVSMLVGKKEYDFVVSSNCLEHVANPVKAMKSWMEIINSGGVILLIVPNKENNFDHRRMDTSFAHLLQDYENNVTEKDKTHFDEIISMHDLNYDTSAGDMEMFRQRCLNNEKNRCFHHHIFHPQCLISLFEYLNLEILFVRTTESDHIILGRKK